jgi:hypothetical protein
MIACALGEMRTEKSSSVSAKRSSRAETSPSWSESKYSSTVRIDGDEVYKKSMENSKKHLLVNIR